MYPPLFALLFASAPVKALLGTTPLRVYAHGEAPDNVAKPYAVWQMIYGLPENYLGSRSDMDVTTSQISVYGDTLSSVRAAASAIRVALEGDSYITALREGPRDPVTKNFRYDLDVDFHTNR